MKNYNIYINGRKQRKNITAENAEFAIRDYCATKPGEDYGFIRKIESIDAETHGDKWAIAQTDGAKVEARLIEGKAVTITINHKGYHGWTSCNIRVKGEPGEIVELTESQTRKLDKTPCGIESCTCGETMLEVLEDWERVSEPCKLRVPEEGTEIEIIGRYGN